MSNNYRVFEFVRKFDRRGPDGKPIPEDWVYYGQAGMANRSSTPARVASLLKIPENADPDNPMVHMARERRDAIMPAYEAWLEGQTLPETGTPLEAFPALSGEEVRLLKQTGLRTVEDLAGASDGIITRVALPNAYQLQRTARAYLDNAGQAQVASELAAKDEQIRTLQDEMAELKKIILEVAKENEPPRPRRGRPPKVRLHGELHEAEQAEAQDDLDDDHDEAA